MMKKLLTLCAVALLAGSVYAGHYADITINDLKGAMASKSVTLLDANGSDSYKEGHTSRAPSILPPLKASWPKSCQKTKGP